MPDPADRFIDAATAPLADNPELQIAARRLLGADLEKSGAPLPPGTVERLTRPPGLLRHWQIFLIITALITGIVTGIKGYQIWASNAPHLQALGSIAGKIPGPPGRSAKEPPMGKDLSPEDRLLLLGDDSKRSKTDRWKALWISDPESPAFYIEYVTAFYSDHKTVPPGFLEKGHELDPSNAWFPAYLAGILAEKAVEPIKRTPAEVAANVPVKYTVKDEAKLRQSRELFGEAARLSLFDSRQRALLARRVALLPKRTSAFDHVPGVAYVAGQRAATLPLRNLTRMIGAESARLTLASDREGLKQLIKDWHAFIAVLAASQDIGLVDGLVKLALMRGGYRDLARAAEALGLEDEAKTMGRIADRLEAYQEQKKVAATKRKDFTRQASLLAMLALPVTEKQVLDPPAIGERLKPGRLAEHEFLTTYATVAIACPTFLLLALGVAAYRFRGGELRRVLSARFEKLMTAGDWLLVLGAGVALPFIFHQLVLRAPWAGAREWSISALDFLTPTASITLVTSLMIILPVVIARHRLGKRAGFIGLHWNSGWLAGAMCVMTVVAIPLAGPMLLPWRPGKSAAACTVIAIAIPQIWMMVVAFRGLFSFPEHLLKRLTLSRVVMPAYVLAFLLTVLSLPISHTLEKRWAQMDELMEVTPEAPSMSRYEEEVTQTLRTEILEVLKQP